MACMQFSDEQLDIELQKRGSRLGVMDDVVQNYLLKELRLNGMTFQEWCKELDRLEFYTRHCLGTLWPPNLFYWLAHCATDQKFQCLREYELCARHHLSANGLVLYRGNLIPNIRVVYKMHSAITKEQYKWARMLALNESLSTVEGSARVQEAWNKQKKEVVKFLESESLICIRDLQDLIMHYAFDCFAYLHCHMPDDMAAEDAELYLGCPDWLPLVPVTVHKKEMRYPWDIVSHPGRQSCNQKVLTVISTHYGMQKELVHASASNNTSSCNL